VKKFAKYSGCLVLFCCRFFVNSLVFMVMWRAFISTPLGIPDLSITESAGLLFSIRFVFPISLDSGSSFDETVQKFMDNIVVEFLYPISALGIAYFISQLV